MTGHQCGHEPGHDSKSQYELVPCLSLSLGLTIQDSDSDKTQKSTKKQRTYLTLRVWRQQEYVSSLASGAAPPIKPKNKSRIFLINKVVLHIIFLFFSLADPLWGSPNWSHSQGCMSSLCEVLARPCFRILSVRLASSLLETNMARKFRVYLWAIPGQIRIVSYQNCEKDMHNRQGMRNRRHAIITGQWMKKLKTSQNNKECQQQTTHTPHTYTTATHTHTPHTHNRKSPTKGTRFGGKQFATSFPKKGNVADSYFTKEFQVMTGKYSDSQPQRYSQTQPRDTRKKGFLSGDAAKRDEGMNSMVCVVRIRTRTGHIHTYIHTSTRWRNE